MKDPARTWNAEVLGEDMCAHTEPQSTLRIRNQCANSLVGITVGVPAGVAVGRIIWRALASNLGVLPVPVVNTWAIAAVAFGHRRPPEHAGGVAVNSSNLYWADGGDAIWEANLDGSNPQTIVSSQPVPAFVAVGPQ